MAIKQGELKPGMWVTFNLLKHQNDYRIQRVKSIGKNIYFDISIILHNCSYKEGYNGKLSKDTYGYPTYAVYKSYNLMKRLPRDKKHSAIDVIFSTE